MKGNTGGAGQQGQRGRESFEKENEGKYIRGLSMGLEGAS